MNEQNLGKYRDDGSIEAMPEFDVVGRYYSRPATIQGIGNGYFVVLPVQSVSDEIIEDARATALALSTPVVIPEPSKLHKPQAPRDIVASGDDTDAVS